MAYKVHVKTLSAYEKNLKQARRERRQAKQQALSVPELPTKEQVEEICSDALASLNAHMRTIMETEHPELLPLIGADWFQTAKHFSDAGRINTLKKASEQCDKELQELFLVVLLSIANRDAQAAEPTAGLL